VPAGPSHLRCPLSLFHVSAAVAVLTAGWLALAAPRWVPAPLLLFGLIFCAAPLLPRLSFFLPVINRGDRRQPWAALTFDDGPDPATTPPLLELLARRNIPAAFFVTGEKAERHPDLIRAILAGGHEIGNHSQSHDVFLMLRGRARLRQEIAQCQNALAALGVRPLAFRPPVGVTNPPLRRVLLDAGMICVCFRRRPADFGNRRLAGLTARVTRGLAAGDILLLHEGLPPRAAAEVGPWLAAVERVLSTLAEKGLRPARLSEVIRRPVMELVRTGAEGKPDPVRLFYDGVAARYDREQKTSGAARLRRAELDAVLSRLASLFTPADRVLEIGAGTGRFSLPLARAAGQLVAVDLSESMLGVLEEKVRAEGLSNIRVLHGDAGRISAGTGFDAVCAFSSLEYFRDLAGLLRHLRSQLKPGGRLYFTIARRSWLRLPAQVGNAVRQGIWLRAYGKRELGRVLRRTGFIPQRIQSFGLKGAFNRGMLWEVIAQEETEAAEPPRS
jgi:peptidoglycan-N-acetylglucosamine deacetylase